jgi:hypothetical protein
MSSERELHLFPKNTFKQIIEQEAINSIVDNKISVFERALRVAAKRCDLYEEGDGISIYNVRLDMEWCLKAEIIIKRTTVPCDIYELTQFGSDIIEELARRFDAEYKGYKRLKVSEGLYISDSSIVLFIRPKNM